MIQAPVRLRWLAALCLPLVAIACSDTTPTSPDADLLDGPQFSVQGGGGLLYAADGAGGNASTLYTLDPATGAATAVGPIGFNGVRGLAFGTDGTLYGLSGDRGPSSQLITIDPATGVGTAVGPIYIPGMEARFDIAIRNGDGVMFVTGFDISCVGLGTVDLGSGAGTYVGNTQTCSPGNGIAFSNADVLYHVDLSGISTVDPVTGAATLGMPLLFTGFPGGTLTPNALANDPATDVLYAAVNGGRPASAGPNYLATVDPATGVVTNIGQSVPGLAALAWEGAGADVTPPTVTAELVPVSDKSVKSKKGLFEVRFSCEDDCDPDATPTATLNDITVENGQVVDLRLRSAKSLRSDKSEKSSKSGKSGKSDKPMKIEAASFELVVVCVDESGNAGVATATPVFAEKSKKSN